jgi:hypothetical protein
MSDTCFYIGTRRRLFEMRAPSVNVPASKVGWSRKIDYLNGGTSVRSSVSAHKQYTMSWNSIPTDEARLILDLADGIYGTGPVYWFDPLINERNMLPQQFASPFQGLYDAIPLNGNGRGTRIATPSNNLDMPSFSIEYTVDPAKKRPETWVPIPPGYTAHIGAYGQNVDGGAVIATPTIGPTQLGTPQTLTLLDVNNDARFNYTVSASAGNNGVLISLGGSGRVILTAMMVQVLKDGVSPKTGGFISGQGHSGCSFIQQPQYTPYSAAIDRVGLVAEFAEVGVWAQ